jgi:hypothetical protein
LAAKIEIARIALSPLSGEEVREAALTTTEDWHMLEVCVRNESERGLHVVSSVRTVEHDEERRRLRLAFAELAEDQVGAAGVPPPAATTFVEPGEETALSTHVASPIIFVELSESGERRLLEVRIDRDVDSVECAVAYSKDPPPPSDLTALEPPAGISDWPVVTASIELG